MSITEIAIKLILLIAVGIVVRKLNIVPEGFDKQLSKLLLSVIIPCMVINSFIGGRESNAIKDYPMVILMSFLSMVVCYILGVLFSLKMKPDMAAMVRFSFAFTNFTFLGLSVVTEIYGEAGVFNYVIFTLVIRVFMYGLGPVILGRSAGRKFSLKDLGRQLLTAPVASVFIGLIIYVTNVPLPQVVTSVISSLGSTGSPLGLVLCGIIIADSDIKGMKKYPSIFLITIVRLIALPAFMLGLYLLIGLDRDLIKTTIFYHAMPCAALMPVFLLRYNPEAKEVREVAGYLVMITTALSIATIPLWTLLVGRL